MSINTYEEWIMSTNSRMIWILIVVMLASRRRLLLWRWLVSSSRTAYVRLLSRCIIISTRHCCWRTLWILRLSIYHSRFHNSLIYLKWATSLLLLLFSLDLPNKSFDLYTILFSTLGLCHIHSTWFYCTTTKLDFASRQIHSSIYSTATAHEEHREQHSIQSPSRMRCQEKLRNFCKIQLLTARDHSRPWMWFQWVLHKGNLVHFHSPPWLY